MTSNGRPAANRNALPIAPSSLDFPVVGIGASAGGLRSLLRFFRAAPDHPGMAFVIILHLSPRHESNAAEVIQGVTAMPVTMVTAPMPVEANHVYVIPPNRQLLMNDGYLRLTETQRPRGRHVTVDLFFRALAEAHGNKAYAVVMSGTGSDGALGLRTVKEAGGVTIAEKPEEAEYDGMPRSAIATGAVDVVLPVEEMPDKLIELWDNARSIGALGGGDPDEAVLAQPLPGGGQGAQEALRDVIVTLREQTGHDFRHYKRATVLRRIERRMQVTGTKNLPGYRDYVRTNLSETTSLLRDMLIGVTSFFRDTDAFEVLEREAVPRIFEARPSGEQVRAWVAGCATGEEAYSLGMLLCDYAAQQEKPPAVQIFATDIDDAALAIGRSGMYPSSIGTDMPPARLRHYFSKEGDAYRVRKGLRDHVLFALHNVLRDPPFSRLDLVSCRNLLIYLDREAQSDVLEMFHFALQPNGYLFLGSSESADAASHLFTPVDKKSRLYRARPVARGGRYAPSLPLGKHDARAVSEVSGVPERRRAASFGDLHRRALEQHAPPSVVVNHDSDIVHISEQAGRYLRYVGGEPTHNLVSLVLPELRLELRTALFEAIQSGKPVERRRAQITRDGRNYNVSMMTRPFRDPETGAEFVLVMFDEVEAPKPADQHATTDSKHDAMVAQLESELQRTKEQLQATIEQAETSTEELKASNEELQAINEELRSATEELETSKEELQSINEELITVNHELKSKVEETGKINDDLQNLIASTNIGTVFVDGNLRIKRFTPRATEIFSIIPTDVGRSLLDITHRLNYDHLSEDVAETFESLRMIEREVRSSDGHWYIARIVPYRTTEDRIEGAVLTFIDITGRKTAEERLRAGEERVSLVLESTKEYAIITMDEDGRVTTWNKGAERYYGYTEEEMLGRSFATIFPADDREAGVPEQELRRARDEGRAEDRRWHVARDGARYFMTGVTTPLTHGSLRGYAKIARDMTGDKQVEHEREMQLLVHREATAQARAAVQLKDEFLAIMSHELKHPLNLIHVNAEILARLPVLQESEPGQRAAATIQRAVEGQAKIIDDLLDFSRVKTGKLKLQEQTIDLAAIVRAIAEAVTRDGEQNGVSLTTAGLDAPVWIRGDSTRVEQIVWNLCSNAMKFTPRGGTVSITLEAEPAMARMTVTDSGIGIPPEALPHIFGLFSQNGLPRTTGRAGLGIGLALVRELTELHGGRVQAESDGAGKGTRFHVWLPLEVGSPAEKPGSHQRAMLVGKRVLLVDDDLDGLHAFAELLQLEGASVTAVASGGEALAVVQGDGAFDVVLSDIDMPEMDGYALMEALRKSPGGADIPVIALTGLGRQADIRRATESGFAAHLVKPVALADLMVAMRNLGARREV